MMHNDTVANALKTGSYGFDGGHEFQIVDISPDGFNVTIEYTSDGDRTTVMRTRFRMENGELRLN